MEENKEVKKKSRKKLYILLGAGTGLLGLTAFGLWWFKFRNPGGEHNEDDLMFKLANKDTGANEDQPSASSPKSTVTKTPVQENASFPLKKGDRGTLVTQLQDALISKYGKDIFSTKKSTGYFGDETAGFLKKKGFPAAIDKATFDKIVADNTPEEDEKQTSTPGSSPPPGSSAPSTTSQKSTLTTKQAIDVAKNIWLNATLRKLPDMVTTLKRMKNVADYTAVNKLFSTLKTNGVKQTIVNAALTPFQFDETSHQMIVQEFERMGLKYDGEKWSLSGIGRSQLITKQPTAIYDHEGTSLDIPENTLLGEVISNEGDVTAFRTTNNKVLYVPTKHVSHV
jgi:cytoskeletal protein RodZ